MLYKYIAEWKCCYERWIENGVEESVSNLLHGTVPELSWSS
jgi:hypothetical protein